MAKLVCGCISSIRSLIGLTSFRPIETIQCSTPRGYVKRQPKSCFGENQLLLGSISFSLQPTSHPKILHHQRVRTSLHLSTEFILLMGSSPSFGSYAHDLLEARMLDTKINWYLASSLQKNALLTLGFPTASSGKGLSLRRVHKLVGSFFNRHAMTVLRPL
jgi:hypothetical protein